MVRDINIALIASKLRPSLTPRVSRIRLFHESQQMVMKPVLGFMPCKVLLGALDH